jgi:hypothetical protein
MATDPNDARRAADDARKFSAQFGGLLKVADALGNVASVEQAAQEAEARLKAVKEAETQAIKDHEETKRKLAADHEDALKRANADVAVVRNRAEEILRGAHDDAKVVAEKAQLAADKTKAAMQAHVDTLAERARKVADDLAATGNELAAKRKELIEVNKQHDQHKTLLEKLREEHNVFLAKIGAR